MIERPRRVVLLIDYDNLQICASRDTPGRDLQLTPVVQLAQRYGTVILARAYAEWNLSTERLAVYKAGIEPAFAPVLRTESDRSGKSLADTVMVAEGMDMLWTLSPEVVVLATSDKDLIPLVRVAKQRGAFVVVLGSDFTAIPLREMADEHVTYRQLITDASGRFPTEAGAARQPAALPEPSRRRSRERNGRERAASPAPAAPAATPRPEREATVSPPSGAPSAAVEPVAPVTAAAAGDADSPAAGRRRRRRGSRRRSDRVGQPGEGSSTSETGGAGDAGEDLEDTSEITPPSGAAEAAQTSSGTVEPPPSGDEFQQPAAPAPEAPAAPRVRRRRTRATTEAAAGEPAAAEAASPPEAPPQLADIPPAPAPEESGPPNGLPAGEEAAPAPRARPRRIASATRGRSRPTTR
jgi:uncharacterized LabA/DUF88 family protein